MASRNTGSCPLSPVPIMVPMVASLSACIPACTFLLSDSDDELKLAQCCSRPSVLREVLAAGWARSLRLEGTAWGDSLTCPHTSLVLACLTQLHGSPPSPALTTTSASPRCKYPSSLLSCGPLIPVSLLSLPCGLSSLHPYSPFINAFPWTLHPGSLWSLLPYDPFNLCSHGPFGPTSSWHFNPAPLGPPAFL